MAEAASLDREAVGVAVRATARPYAPGWLHILLRRLDELPGPALAAYVVIGAAQSLVFHLIPWSKGTAPVGQLDTINLYQDETERRLKGLLAELGRDVDARDLARADGLNKTLDSLLRQREVIGKLPTWPWSTGSLRAVVTAILLPLFLFIIQLLLTRIL